MNAGNTTKNQQQKDKQMPIVGFSDRDILRSKIIKPGWYVVRIDGVSEGLSKDGGSTNYPIEATIVRSDEGDFSTEFAGVPTPYWNFNSKAPGFMVGYFAALGVEVKAGSRYRLEDSVGKEIAVFIANDVYEGRTVNKHTHQYRVPTELPA